MLKPCLALVLGAALIVPAAADSSEETDLPLLARCQKSTEIAVLRDCVSRLIRLTVAQDGLDQTQREMVKVCAESATVDKVRACLGAIYDPVADGKRKFRREALENATRTWELSTTRSRMDGTPGVFLRLDSDDEIESRATRMRPVLWLRCMENATNVLVLSNWYVPSGRGVPVVWKAGDDKAVAQTWEAADNGKGVGLWSGDRAIPFIKTLLGKSSLLMRVTPYQEGPREFAFNIDGLDTMIGPLRRACNW